MKLILLFAVIIPLIFFTIEGKNATQESIAKSKNAKITVQMKEKYGPAVTYEGLTVIMLYNNAFYLINREGTQAILPTANWAITSLTNEDIDEDEENSK